MSTGQDGWYIAEPTGETTGPMTRTELTAQFNSGRHGRDALCWHVDVAEWQPLARVASGTRGIVADAGHAGNATRRDPAAAEAAAAAYVQQARQPAATTSYSDAKPKAERAQERAERKRMKREAMAKLEQRYPDDGKRLLSHPASGSASAATAAAAATATTTAAKPSSTAKADPKLDTAFVPIALRRFAARVLDTALIGLPAAALLWGGINRFLVNIDPSIPYWPPVLWGLGLLAVFGLLPIEAIAIGLFGRTPGKALLGLSVARPGGGSPGLFLGVRRAREVLVRGLALGIPVLAPITILASGARLINHGSTSWDQRVGLVTRAEPIDARRVQIVFGVLVGTWFLLNTEQFATLLARLALLPWNAFAPG